MSTHFFERQSKARRNTIWLILMFVIATIVTVAVVYFAGTMFGNVVSDNSRSRLISQSSNNGDAAAIGALAAIGAGILILLGSLFKIVSLRHGGGTGVAESVGGMRLFPEATEFKHRRLLNVVEEMAIASGTPVPPVFLLDEPGINAFAAGYSPSDAVIGVTQGAIDHFDREQLQGVIAHEFSHILNGDMRMNIRMIGILHGILLLSLVGKIVLRSASFSSTRRSRSRNGNGAALLLIGLALLVIGSVGSFFGGLIKAAVSRQREFLADASAVQFTRNPGGIAGALKTIGSAASESRLRHANATVASHMYFAKGVFEGLTGTMATHPPLARRILAIEPSWDGLFPTVSKRELSERNNKDSRSYIQHTATAGFAESMPTSQVADEVPTELISDAAEHVGAPEEYHRKYAAELIEKIQPELLDSLRQPYSARAAVLALLMSRDEPTRNDQLSSIAQELNQPFIDLTMQLEILTSQLADELRLPVIDLALPALAAISKSQYESFMRVFRSLAHADKKISIFEWTLAQILMRHLKPRFEPVRSPIVRYYRQQRLTNELSTLISCLSLVGHEVDESILNAFRCGAEQLTAPIQMVPRDACSLKSLNHALKTLSTASAKIRGAALDASAACICADQHVRVREAELLRGIADLLDCPVPPLIQEQR